MNDRFSAADVLVIGGGVIGCALARELAASGARVRVLERDQPVEHASAAAAGMLSPLAEAADPGEFLSLLRAGRELFPALARELREEVGAEIGYRDEGTLFLALTEEDERELTARYTWQKRTALPVELLDREAALSLEPALSPSLRWALRFPDDHQVDSRRFAEALRDAALAAGAEISSGARVAEVSTTGGRVSGVRLSDGQRIGAAAVVVAAGCWSGEIGGLPRALPVRPVHGQLLALATDQPLLAHVVDTPRVYLVPRAGGRVVVGTTVEEIGFRKRVSEEATALLRAAAAEAVPALMEATLAESWSGLRPGTPDGLPILGADPALPGLFHATGHFRNGILLAPITAELVGAAVLGRSPRLDLSPYSVARFTGARREV